MLLIFKVQMFFHHLVQKKKNSETKIFITERKKALLRNNQNLSNFYLKLERKTAEQFFQKTVFAQGDVHMSFGGKFHGKPF